MALCYFMSEYFVMIIMVVINKTVLLTVVAPANNQSKEVEYSGYMPGQAVQVCIC